MSCCIYSEFNKNKNSLEEISDYLNLQIVNKIPVSGSFLEIKEEGLCFTNDATTLLNIFISTFYQVQWVGD